LHVTTYFIKLNSMAQLSDRLNRLAPSATLAMSQKSNEMKAQGIDVINMSVGEPDFNTPEHIKAAGQKAIADNYSKYSPVPGYMALREAVVEKLQRENGLTYKASEIIVGTGGKQGVCNTILALVNPGDEVIIPAPYWVSYPQMVKLAGGIPVTPRTTFESNFKLTPAQLESLITPKTKMLVLCSPSNPTGSVYSKEELKQLADVVLKHENLFVLSDEIYEHINYVGKHESIAQFEGMKERVVICNGVSKAYAMTGWRLGWTAAPEWIVKGMNKLQSQYTSGTCDVSQMAALAAYKGDQQCVEDMRKAFERRRDLIVKLAKEIPGLGVNMPEGAFYLFPKCSNFFGKTDGTMTIHNSTDFSLYLLEKAHVATVAGDAFGEPDGFRMSYATSDENIKEALKRIKEALAKLY
jgi:aspartate aminotransferase